MHRLGSTPYTYRSVALTETLVLACADYSLPFVVYTNASNQGLGAVLAQVQDGREWVIAYASCSLQPTKQNDAILQLVQTRTFSP